MAAAYLSLLLNDGKPIFIGRVRIDSDSNDIPLAFIIIVDPFSLNEVHHIISYLLLLSIAPKGQEPLASVPAVLLRYERLDV